MRFRMLGDLEAENAGRLVPLGRVVPLDRLVAALWDGEPPTTAAKQVRNTVWRLRRLLAYSGMADVVLASGTGYRLAAGSECIDAGMFESEVAQHMRVCCPDSNA